MSVNPALRLVFLTFTLLILFFFGITYVNILASKNVQLSNIHSDINAELSMRSDNQERISQELNKDVRMLTRSERISRVSPDSTIKIKDIAPSTARAAPVPHQSPVSTKDPSIVVR